MPVSHAHDTSVTSPDERAAGEVPSLLEVLARITDPRRRRGRRFVLTFVLAVAVACALAGVRSFREAGDTAADLPQEVLARLGGRPHQLLRRIIAQARRGSAPWSTRSARTSWTRLSAAGCASWRMPGGWTGC